ncbi:MAG TPA: asparagine synthase (glutamine-hydrolyzing) [Syntrophobacteraceae bacterium]|nr:asparagine synthase (glutamine-hydrolyzing) [Syntrophobacteraceae bacterium]
MCGILGVLQRYPSGSRAFSLERLALLRHRGPDGQGIYSDDRVALGHTRLSIIDLSQLGAQPMFYADKRYVITYNGEIYNYLELREDLSCEGFTFSSRSDTEVILAAYHAYGPGCVERFRGMFAFGIWDSAEQKLFLARDRCGERPLIYWRDEESLIFASEIKALLPLMPSIPALDPAPVDMYLHFQYVPEPFTPLAGMHKLPAAHTLTVCSLDWNASPKCYWDFEWEPGENNSIGNIREELEKSVTLMLRSDVPIGVALSGGIDSGCVATLASRHYPQPMHAFCVGYPGRPAYDEREDAKALANELGMIFHEVELPVDDFLEFFPQLVRIMDEPLADYSAFGHYSVPKAASELGIKVMLSGLGGDELFWGYPWVAKAVSINLLRASLSDYPFFMEIIRSPVFSPILKHFIKWRLLPRSWRDVMRKLSASCFSKTPEDQLVFMTNTGDFDDAFQLKADCYGEAMTAVPADAPFMPTKGVPNLPDKSGLAVLRLLFRTWLVSNCLTLSDRVSMAVGVETRLPFLDHRLIELVMRLRRGTPDHQLGHKAGLRQVLEGVLPEEVLNRPKRGFQPPEWKWLSSVVSKYGQDLCGGKLEAAGIVSRKGTKALLANFASQGWPTLFFAYKLVLLEQWLRLVVFGAGGPP